jgi:hypothetical protein
MPNNLPIVTLEYCIPLCVLVGSFQTKLLCQREDVRLHHLIDLCGAHFDNSWAASQGDRIDKACLLHFVSCYEARKAGADNHYIRFHRMLWKHLRGSRML